MIVASFYTKVDGDGSDYYWKACARLEQDCDNLGLRSFLQEELYQGSWIDTLRLKPRVMIEALEFLQEDILWIDCDGRLLQDPMLGGFHGDVGFVPKNPPLRPAYMGCLYLRYGRKTIEFLSDWRKIYTNQDSEEMTFGKALKLNPDLTVVPLPKPFMIIDQGQKLPPGTIVAHGLSKSKSKTDFYNSR